MPPSIRYPELLPYGIKPYGLAATSRGTRNPPKIECIVIHHTAGTNSVEYLETNPRQVSAHFLVTKRSNGPYFYMIYQYMPLQTGEAYHAGPSSLGGYPNININSISIGIEIEGPPFPLPLLPVAARLTAAVIQYCRDRGSDPFLIGHKHIQADKQDPQFIFSDFEKLVYSNLPMYKAAAL